MFEISKHSNASNPGISSAFKATHNILTDYSTLGNSPGNFSLEKNNNTDFFVVVLSTSQG
jgi:hypothetical protein